MKKQANRVVDIFYDWFQDAENHPDYTDEDVEMAANLDDIKDFTDFAAEALIKHFDLREKA